MVKKILLNLGLELVKKKKSGLIIYQINFNWKKYYYDIIIYMETIY
jgi:hypothetical protein